MAAPRRPRSGRAESRPARADPRCGVSHVRRPRLPRRRDGRHRGRRRDLQGRRLLPLPDQGVDLPRADAHDRGQARGARSSARWRPRRTRSPRRRSRIRTVLATFAGHRTMARLLFLDVIGAGRVFQAEADALHDRFARLIQGYLDQAVAEGVIPPTDTRVSSIAWFGALNEVVGALAARRSIPAGSRTPIRRCARCCCAAWACPRTRIAAVPAPAAGAASRRRRDDRGRRPRRRAERRRAGAPAAERWRLPRGPGWRRRRGSPRDRRRRAGRRHRAVRGGRRGRPGDRALAAAVRGPRARRASGGRGRRGGRAGPVRATRERPGASCARRPARRRDGDAAARPACCWAGWASTAAARRPTTPGRRSARRRWCCPLLLVVDARRDDADGIGRSRRRRRREPRPRPAPCERRSGCGSPGRAPSSPADGLVARPVVAPLAIVDERPDREAWDRLVGLMAGAVGRGRLDKVVLARRVDCARRPSSTCRTPCGGWPRRPGERRLRVPPRRPDVPGRDAGAAGRARTGRLPDGGHRRVDRRGADAAEDEALAAELLASDKDREEHAVVVRRPPRAAGADRGRARASRPSRRPDAAQRAAPRRPRSRARCRARAGLLALAGRLHPTPAVGGEPHGRGARASSPSTRASIAAGTPGPSAGWAPTATAS